LTALGLENGLEILRLDMEIAETTLAPDLRKCAFLLDIDDTILDRAPSLQQDWVPTGLWQTLAWARHIDRRRLGTRLRPLAPAMRLSRSWEDATGTGERAAPRMRSAIFRLNADLF
jgi:hypothetical protein